MAEGSQVSPKITAAKWFLILFYFILFYFIFSELEVKSELHLPSFL